MVAILGLNFSHNPSAVLILDSKLICAYEEEKLRGIKGYKRFPWLAIMKCTENLSNLSSINVALGFNNLQDVLISHRNLNRIADKKYRLFYIFDFVQLLFPIMNITSKTLKLHLRYILRKNLGVKVKLKTFDHHLSHAASAIFGLNWEEGVCLTLDGWGDDYSGSFSTFKQNRLKVLDRISYLDSIGALYSQVTRALGFKASRHEGKIMGLAALGDHSSTYKFLNEKIKDCELGVSEFGISNLTDTQVYGKLLKFRPGLRGILWTRIESKAMRRLQLSHNYYSELIKQLIHEGFSREDIAAGVQEFTERRVVNYLSNKYLQFNVKPTNLALAGGVFANVKLNQKIFEQFGLRDIFIQPAMDDAGTALGSAALFHQAIQPNNPISNKEFKELVYLGNSYDSNRSLSQLCKSSQLQTVVSNDIAQKIATLIFEGFIVGVFQGNLEWGPRALGNRSILAGAHVKNMSKTLNSKLSRNDFMPFAPMVIDEDLSDFIYLKSQTLKVVNDVSAFKFMTMTGNVNSKFKEIFPEVVHVDGTARPQKVSIESNELIFKILTELKKLIGLGVMINTSFNLHETPIIESPKTAINLLKTGKIDYLFIDGNLYSY